MPLRLSRSHRLANRRLWALHVLSLHVEKAGACGFCAATYDADQPWPCVPARIALLYVGEPKP